MVGKTLGHYTIVAAIGAGGMGEVYRAADTKLGRDVALKLLPQRVANDPDALARFRREARAVATLNHPNIVTIYSVEEADGVLFLTIELVEGQSLKELIGGRALPVERIVEIGRALTDAVAAAHEKGIMHRDLKPANVMVTTDGRVKVLDFGLAKEISNTNESDVTLTSADQTKAGTVMGTPAYMSPEQVSGREIDHRTDIFSIGVVLYEMASGERPFEGRSAAAISAAILCDEPRPVGERRVDLPAALSKTIHRCLEKKANDRFASARDLRAALHFERAADSTASAATESSHHAQMAKDDSAAARALEGFWIVVLPFKYGGTNGDIAAVGEGLADEIVIGMSRFSYLKVLASSSTARYGREDADARAAGKDLGAQYVVEGSIRHAGSRLRIAVHLVETSTGTHLWSETYDRAFQGDDVFALQDQLVPRIVSTIADTYGVLPRNMGEKLRGVDPDKLTPYEAVLRSFAHFPRLSAEEHLASRTALERAVQQAPGYADGWALLSMMIREEYLHGFNVKADPLGRAMTAAQRAVEVAPANHLAYHALAATQFFRKEKQAFRNSAERAMSLNRMDGFTIAYLGFLLAYAGDWERGCALVAQARELNPHHPGWYWFPSVFDAYNKKDFRGALDFVVKVNMPGFWRTNMALATIYGQLGEVEKGHAAVRELLAVRPGFAAAARVELGKWWEPELVEQLVDGLRKAGLEVAAF
ncbi:MAG TPA: protein kinase [Candidatus Acidoferrum sp.]